MSDQAEVGERKSANEEWRRAPPRNAPPSGVESINFCPSPNGLVDASPYTPTPVPPTNSIDFRRSPLPLTGGGSLFAPFASAATFASADANDRRAAVAARRMAERLATMNMPLFRVNKNKVPSLIIHEGLTGGSVDHRV